jgi:hypothetical protein
MIIEKWYSQERQQNNITKKTYIFSSKSSFTFMKFLFVVLTINIFYKQHSSLNDRNPETKIFIKIIVTWTLFHRIFMIIN